MDFDPLAATITKQAAAMLSAPIPFVVAVGIATYVIWRALRWRYDSIIERLRAEVIYLEKAVGRPETAPERPEQIKPEPVKATALECSAQTTAARQSEKEFLPSSITPKIIAGLRKDLTNLQAAKITSGYVGKWMKVTGTVFNVSATKEYQSLLLLPEDATASDLIELGISVIFDGDGALDHLKKGSSITCSGQVSDISGLGITLQHGELIE